MGSDGLFEYSLVRASLQVEVVYQHLLPCDMHPGQTLGSGGSILQKFEFKFGIFVFNFYVIIPVLIGNFTFFFLSAQYKFLESEDMDKLHS